LAVDTHTPLPLETILNFIFEIKLGLEVQALADTGPDDDLFDGLGGTGIHAIERILWAGHAPADVVAFESMLDGYVAASFPANMTQRIYRGAVVPADSPGRRQGRFPAARSPLWSRRAGHQLRHRLAVLM
jgi:hypothetical protein